MAESLAEIILGSKTRGENLTMPLVEPVRPYVHRRTERIVDLPFVVMGDFDALGNPHANALDGLVENALTLEDALGIGEDSGNDEGTVPAVFTSATGAIVLGADVQVLGFGPANRLTPSSVRTTIGLKIPSGRFVEVVGS
jgi:hypothetical protein